MAQKTCPNCGASVSDGMLACPKCSTLLFDPHISTVHMRVDPQLLRLRRKAESAENVPVNEHTVLLQIRGMTERLIFEEGTEVVLGRADLTYPPSTRFDLTRYGAHERGVSREHAVLRFSEGRLTITDLNSANGTTVNLKKLNPNESCPLYNGDTMTLGNLSITIRIESTVANEQKKT